jgi:hypothetical protein
MGTFKFGHGLDRLGYQASTAGPAGARRLNCPPQQSDGRVAMELRPSSCGSSSLPPSAIESMAGASPGLAVGTNAECFSS